MSLLPIQQQDNRSICSHSVPTDPVTQYLPLVYRQPAAVSCSSLTLSPMDHKDLLTQPPSLELTPLSCFPAGKWSAGIGWKHTRWKSMKTGSCCRSSQFPPSFQTQDPNLISSVATKCQLLSSFPSAYMSFGSHMTIPS